MSASTAAPALAPTTPPRFRIVERPEPDVFEHLGGHWLRFDRVPFGATVEIDHVLVSTAGVFVATVVDTSSGLLHALGVARRRARKIGYLVDRVGRPHVTAMLIVSKPVEQEMVDGVLVCSGADAARWCAELDALASTLTTESVNQIVDILVDHTLRTDAVNRSYAAG